jgi:endoglucanase
MFELIEKLVQIDAPTGREAPMRAFLTTYLNGKCEFFIDTLGNVIAHKKGDGRKIMLTAPMDEPTFLLKKGEKPYYKFETVGKTGTAQLFGRKLKFDGKKGVIAVCPVHLSNGDDKLPKADSLYFECYDEPEQGAFGVFDSESFNWGKDGGLIGGKALSSRACIAALLETLDVVCEADLWLVFAARGNLNAGGVKAATETIKPDIAIVVQGNESGTFDPDKEPELGLPVIDSGAVHNEELLNEIKTAAETLGIKTIIPTIRPTCPAGTIAQCAGGIRTAFLALPTRLPGSDTESCRKKDIEALSKLLNAVILK